MISDSERAFLVAIEAPLAGGDLPMVIARLKANWPPERLVGLTASEHEGVVKIAATCLGMTGSMEHCECLAGLLGHSNEQVVQVSENALWTIWMQAGSEQACRKLSRALQLVKQNELEAALEVLNELIVTNPDFSEAHHQKAMALHALDRGEEAEAAYRATVELNPNHFPAMAGLGHLHVQRADFNTALKFYKAALKIHPQLAEIRDLVPQFEAALDQRDVA